MTSEAGEAAPTPAAPTTPDDLWDELIMHALASDGPIRDSDVKEAVRYYRPKIEAAIAAQAVQIGFREGASQVAHDRDDKVARSTPAEALDVPDGLLPVRARGKHEIEAAGGWVVGCGAYGEYGCMPTEIRDYIVATLNARSPHNREAD